MFAEKFARDGMLVLDRLVAPDLVMQIAESVAARTASVDYASSLDHAVDAGRLHLPVRLEGPLLDPGVWGSPILEAILTSILGSDYVIDNMALVNALAGAPMMHLHRDFGALFPGQLTHSALPAYAVTMILPLVETNDETGTTAIARGSMDSVEDGQGDLEPPGDWVTPHVPLGGAVLMDYRVWHRGLPNRSGSDRPILYMIFSRDWFTDCRNFETHSRMIVDRRGLMEIPLAHRHRFRRVAAAGLVDATIAELEARRPDKPTSPA